MQSSTTTSKTPRPRQTERGAALISALLISTLLLAGGTALVMTTSMQAVTTISSTAEVQSYYAAEAGVHSALNVIRGNVAPSTGSGIPTGTLMSGNFQTAVLASTSNRAGDPMSTQSPAVTRLSAWLNYSYPSTLSNSTIPTTANRVPLTIMGSTYNPATDLAFSIEVRDPDNTPVGTEPSRLIISSTGYGPNGAIKVLQVMISKSAFNIEPPATITIRGSDDGSALNFDSGSSNAKQYSGVDNHGGDSSGAQADKPVFATTGPYIDAINSGIKKPDTVTPQASGTPLLGVLDIQTGGVPTSGVSTTVLSTPSIFESADNSRAAVANLREMAEEMGVYVSGSYDGTVGSSDTPAFLFVDGDADLEGGAGLLVVTGTLRMHGNPNFEGLILVLGEGTVTRDGGGNGSIYGALMIAKFDSTGGFLGPTYNTNGGGNSVMQFDSEAIRRALNVTGRPVLGVVER